MFLSCRDKAKIVSSVDDDDDTKKVHILYEQPRDYYGKFNNRVYSF